MTNWPHAPPHKFVPESTYFVTGATYQKVHYFNNEDRLKLLHDTLLNLAQKYKWNMQAWAVFVNHYHFIAFASKDAEPIDVFLKDVHFSTAKEINIADNAPERKVWYQFRDTRLTFIKSYCARLNYVIQNPVKHKLVPEAKMYPWCSAAHFEKTSPKSFVKTIESFKTDKLGIYDDYL
jgi:putative transposase